MFFIFVVGVLIHGLGLGLAPFGLVAAADRDGQETAVFVEQSHDFVLFEKLLSVVGNVQHDFGAALAFVNLFHRELGGSVAAPFHRLGVGVRLGEDIDSVGHHE